jgi:hypothetical protein
MWSSTLHTESNYLFSKRKREDVMRLNILDLTTLVATSSMLLIAHANAEEKFHAVLSGFEEVGGVGAGETGAIFSRGKGTLDLVLNDQATMITYTLTFSGLSAVTQSHTHFGKEHVAGGVMVFFCTNLSNGPAGTPGCPLSGPVTGNLTAASVVGPTAQGITAGNFDAVVEALRSNTAYVNIHTTAFPAGEIRGQIHRPDDDKH